MARGKAPSFSSTVCVLHYSSSDFHSHDLYCSDYRPGSSRDMRWPCWGVNVEGHTIRLYVSFSTSVTVAVFCRPLKGRGGGQLGFLSIGLNLCCCVIKPVVDSRFGVMSISWPHDVILNGSSVVKICTLDFGKTHSFMCTCARRDWHGDWDRQNRLKLHLCIFWEINLAISQKKCPPPPHGAPPPPSPTLPCTWQQSVSHPSKPPRFKLLKVSLSLLICPQDCVHVQCETLAQPTLYAPPRGVVCIILVACAWTILSTLGWSEGYVVTLLIKRKPNMNA